PHAIAVAQPLFREAALRIGLASALCRCIACPCRVCRCLFRITPGFHAEDELEQVRRELPPLDVSVWTCAARVIRLVVVNVQDIEAFALLVAAAGIGQRTRTRTTTRMADDDVGLAAIVIVVARAIARTALTNELIEI